MRLIDEVALINEAESGGWDTDTKELRMILKYVPTIDAVPVVHGEWIDGLEFDHDESVYVCSICNEPWVLTAGTPSENSMNFCPNCGAKMDGEK